ncbi:MAG: CRISPR-associated protein Cas5 [Aggregatilineales bacterium]
MAEQTRTVVRLRLEGAVTSFRYPHFMHGVQPTFEMPPPATLYGHVCSALGELVSPSAFRIAVHFTASERFFDYEHTHLFGREPKLSPFERELIFQPRLTLYVDRPDWLDQLRKPRYVVVLGRSQDLMRCAEVRLVDLVWLERAYVEHALLEFEDALGLERRVSVMMPRMIDLDRRAFWGQYAIARAPQEWNAPSWCDPLAPHWRDRLRAVRWLSFIDQPRVFDAERDSGASS